MLEFWQKIKLARSPNTKNVLTVENFEPLKAALQNKVANVMVRKGMESRVTLRIQIRAGDRNLVYIRFVDDLGRFLSRNLSHIYSLSKFQGFVDLEKKCAIATISFGDANGFVQVEDPLQLLGAVDNQISINEDTPASSTNKIIISSSVADYDILFPY